MLQPLELWNPFDSSDKQCFPDLHGALHGESTSPVVDISLAPVVSFDDAHPPLGHLPLETSQLLEARCQAWFDDQAALKAVRVSATKTQAVRANWAVAWQATLCTTKR